MTQDQMDLFMSLNVSAIFTFLNKGSEYKHLGRLLNNLENVYSIDKDGCEEYLFFSFHHDNNIEDDIDKIDYLDKIYTEEYVILKVDKWDWMSKKEWELMKVSNYYDFRDAIYDNANRSKTNLMYHIINKTEIIIDKIETLCNINIKENNISWKGFNFEKEVLDLSKLTNMKILGIREKWFLEQMENALSYEKHIYQKILENSFDVNYVAPKEIALAHKPKSIENKIDYKQVYEKIKAALKSKTGKEQYQLLVKGNRYPLICNYVDFKTKLEKVIKKYKLTDNDTIEQCLINHVCKIDFPVLKYYIDKDNTSQLASDYESFSESNSPSIVSNQPKESNKNLFG
jgi:hypothetical protein